MSNNTLTEIRRAIVLLKEVYDDTQKQTNRIESLCKLLQAEVCVNVCCNLLVKQIEKGDR